MDVPDLPTISCRHLLICRAIWYDAAKPEDGYSPGRLIVDLAPPPGEAARFVVPRLFAFAQLYGDIGDYDVRVCLVEVTIDEEGDEAEQLVYEWGPWLVPVSGLELVESYSMTLNTVPFERPGVYEFQLWSDEHDAPLATERVRIIEPIRELP